MRAQSIFDRDGNSYRYYRAVHKVKEIEERKAQEQRWVDIYEKASDNKLDVPKKRSHNI